MKTIVATQTTDGKTVTRRKAIRFASLLFVGALGCCASVALVTRAHMVRNDGSALGKLRSTEASSNMRPAQEKTQKELTQTVRVFIHPEDIYCDVITVRPGKIRLVAENKTQSDVSLVLERVNPGQSPQTVAQVRTVDRGIRNMHELTVGAGEYVFYEESRPQQQGKIIVNPELH